MYIFYCMAKHRPGLFSFINKEKTQGLDPVNAMSKWNYYGEKTNNVIFLGKKLLLIVQQILLSDC